ncbi:MAG TPA: M56 family metallopeptidase [Thermoanaerobaculia bacterium]|nr:M56 family metallopeptidase [Thermoanaerobaculia bacterium]
MSTVLLINSMVIATATAVALFAAARLASRAAIRFALWYAGLTAVAVLSPLTLLLPPRHVTGWPGGAGGGRIVVMLWATVAVIALARTAFGFAKAMTVLHDAVDDPRIARIAADVRGELGCRRDFRTCLSPVIRSPQFIGLWRPTIALPAAFASFDDSSLRAVLLHEVEHVRRRDDWLIVHQAVVKSIFIWNPAVAAITRRIDFERELACDEAACRHVAPSAYAEVICRVAVKAKAALILAAASTALTRRMVELLSRASSRRSSDGLAIAAAACAVVISQWAALPLLVRREAPVPKIERALPTDIGDAEAEGAEHFVNGGSLFGADQYEQAISEFAKSRELGYEVAASAYNIGVAYDRLGDPEKARHWKNTAYRSPGST